MSTLDRAAPLLECGSFRFRGEIGAIIDRFNRNRICGPAAWTTIYPEAEEAFRARVDDRRTPRGGEWQGEFWGRWVLSAVAAHRYHPDAALREFLRTAARGLISTQDADGYIGTYFDSSRVGPGTWNVWGRKYTLWGLLELHDILGDDAILEAATRHADHLIRQVGPGGVPIRETGQFHGLASTSILTPMIGLHRATGDARYLDYARYIVDQWSAEPGAPPDILGKALQDLPVHQWFDAPDTWAKGSELLSCVEGLVDLYEVTADTSYLQAARNVHRQIAAWERTVVGTVTFDDKFTASRYLRNGCAEICEVVYWNRLSHRLFLHTGDAAYADEIERSLHNSLLGAMNPAGDWGIRRQRFSHRHIPAHPHCGLEHHQCCVDTLPRGLFHAAESVVLHDDAALYVAGYAAGTGAVSTPAGQQAVVRIAGDYPVDSKVAVHLAIDRPERFLLRLRMPGWATEMPAVRVDGEPCSVAVRDGWVELDRRWNPRTQVSVDLRIRPSVERFDHRALGTSHPLVEMHRRRWLEMGFVEEGKGSASGLTERDLRPNGPAVAIRLGPLTLARDARLGGGPLFSPVRLPAGAGAGDAPQIELDPIPAPAGIRHAFRMTVPGSQPIDLCDFASAGNTWDDESTFTTWLDVEE